jgi:hypothetical protein
MQEIYRKKSPSGGPLLLLRLEGLCVLIASCVGYKILGLPWSVFACCFLLPDISFFGYLAGSRAGTAFYNAAHTYVSVFLVAGCLYFTDKQIFPFFLIWTAHIGFDRALGYGLKYVSGFGDTHLGEKGKSDPSKSI